jgi:HPt (histidine-containing phosphotransfer) domain-containing protein
MNDRATAAQARLNELAAKFLDRTSEDIDSMRQDLARSAGEDAAAIGHVRHLAHRMVGTGATLGFDSLSECARRLETLAESCAPGAVPGEPLRAQLAEALDALAADLRRLRSQASSVTSAATSS